MLEAERPPVAVFDWIAKKADEIGPAVDTFGGASGEKNAREFAVFGYAFLARNPE